MNITFDPEKDASNLQKHGMSLYVAKLLDWDSALIWQDTRHAYGENRMVALGPIVDRLYCAVYVDR
ncbi:BrnT family toxin, partial [Acinetobacter baumannii]